MSFKDLDITNRGWLELERARRFDRWEQTRSLFSLHIPKGRTLNSLLPNPYAPKPKKGPQISREELDKRLTKWDGLEFKDHPHYKKKP